MLIPHATLVAVADGEKLNLYRNAGTEAEPRLTAMEAELPSGDNHSGGARHLSSAANPDESTAVEDSFAAATAAMLNTRALDGKFKALVVIAAPRTLGELRKHWHKVLEAKLLHEMAKDLTGHSIADIEAALARA